MFSMQDFLGRQKNSNDIAYELIRIFLGAALLTRGVLFMTNQTSIMELVEQRGMDWLFPMIIIHYITLAHLCGGAMMTLGLLTRVAALVQIPILIGAVFFIHLQDGLFTQGQSFELSVLVLFLLVVVFIFGAGKYSLDQSILAKVVEQDDPKMVLQRVQQSVKTRRERVVREILDKKEKAASGLSTALSPSDRAVGLDAPSGMEEVDRSTSSILYTILAYGLIFSLIIALLLLDVIQIPEGIPVGAIIGGGIVVFLLLGMFFLIYGSALNESK